LSGPKGAHSFRFLRRLDHAHPRMMTKKMWMAPPPCHGARMRTIQSEAAGVRPERRVSLPIPAPSGSCASAHDDKRNTDGAAPLVMVRACAPSSLKRRVSGPKGGHFFRFLRRLDHAHARMTTSENAVPVRSRRILG
jgi:hypothetical protein